MSVCSIDYIGQRFPASRADEIAAIHLQIENDFKSAASGVIQANNTIHQFVLKNTRSMPDLNKANAAVIAVNAHYEKPVITKGRYQNNQKIFYNINVGDFITEREFRVKSALDKINNDPYRVVDGEITNPSDYERKAKNLENTPLDTLEEFFKKAEHMQNTFTNKGIDTYIIMDGDQTEPGQILADKSKTVTNLRNQGAIGENTKVISVNPNLMFNDVITHEFSHLFIDAIGGMENSRISNAYNKLIGTDIYNRVAELYGELDRESDKFKKEVVATALGQEGNTVFENNATEKTWWDNFRDWVFTRMQNLLGISNKNVIRELAEDMINGKFSATSNVSSDNYFYKIKTPLKDMVGTRITNLNEANKAISINISKMVNTFEGRTGVKITPINPNESYEVYSKNKDNRKISQQAFFLSQMKTIEEAIVRLNDQQTEKTILTYINIAIESIDRNVGELKAIKINNAATDQIAIDIALKKLESIIVSNGSFELLEKLSQNIDELNTTNEIKKVLHENIETALSKKNSTHNEFLKVSKDILVRRLKPLEVIIVAERKEQLEVEYNQNKNNPTGRVIADETKEDFINRILNEDSVDIDAETEAFVRENLSKSITDVGTLELFLRSENSMNSMVIRLASRIMNKASYNYTKSFIEKRADAQDIFKEYYTKYGSINQKQMWKAVTQESNGEVFMKSKYDIQFFEEYNKLNNAAQEAKNNDKLTKPEIDVIVSELETWVKENTKQVMVDPVDNITALIPIAKWVNKEYKAIMDNPTSIEAKMLKFLEKTIGQSDTNYNNKLRLVRTPFGNVIEQSAAFFKMPAMRKDTIEKAISGDYLANAKDTLKELYTFNADDVERFGDIVDELEDGDSFDSRTMRKVISNTQGEEKHNIPIYFRRKFDPKLNTYDVMTAVLSDFYMSSQFKEKTEIQPLLDILLIVTANKEIGESAGIRNLNKMISATKDTLEGMLLKKGESKEYTKLKSMIENRLYNITTTDAEFGKVAQTVMAWTGSVMMSLNFFSGVANVMQGKMMNFLESVGGNFYDAENLTNAEKKFFADMGGWMNDLGSVTNESKTRLMIDLLNVQGDFIGVKERYIRANRGLALASRKSLTAPNAVGEFYTQATLMYAMMDRIKAKDKQSNYLDKEFKPTKDKTKAISLDEAITVEKGKLVVHPSVFATTFSPNAEGNTDNILEETRVLIKKMSSDLHGQYDNELQAHFQRGTWGKFIFMFRKWLVPGFDRRWRGTANLVYTDVENGKKVTKFQDYKFLRDEDNRKNRFFSSDLKQFQEGTYTSFIRMMTSLYKEGEMLSIATMSLGDTEVWSDMTDTEKANVKKTAMEYAVIILTIASAYLLKGLAEDLPEDDPAYTAMMLGAFSARRLHMELVAFSNPLEALVLMKSPAASVSLLQKSSRLLLQIGKDTAMTTFGGEGFERYERGDMKGELKVKKYFNDIIPVANQVNRNLDDAVTFLFQSY
tara:strand:+ start:25445 stop:29839 length:4395 start_codon:yes stop_codon:yes gene_type:complete